jgi:hypothetical protein
MSVITVGDDGMTTDSGSRTRVGTAVFADPILRPTQRAVAVRVRSNGNEDILRNEAVGVLGQCRDPRPCDVEVSLAEASAAGSCHRSS